MFDTQWDTLFATKEWGKYPPEHVVRFVARNWYRVPDRSTVKLLDIGCGPGACSWFMAREGFSVCGIDGSPTAITKANKRLSDENLSADLRVGDFCKPLPWPDSFFDGVIDNAAILYANGSWKAVLGEVHRVLKPGGRLHSACFGKLCTRPLEGQNTYVDLAEARFLYDSFSSLSIDHDVYTEGVHTMELWLCCATK